MTLLSGTPIRLAAGDLAADIATVGASVRTLTASGRPLVVPFAAAAMRPVYRGALLAPWPNRVVDGRYRFDGSEYQLAITEPERGHALHGLTPWLDFAVVEHSDAHVLLGATVQAQAGYPFQLGIEVRYELTEAGFVTLVTASNTGDRRAPYGVASHPYLVAGPGRVDDWSLELPAETVLDVHGARLLPAGTSAVAGGPLDFRTPRQIGATAIDHAYTGLTRQGGATTARVTCADGSGVAMTWDSGCPWVQIHTADRPEPEANRVGLAMEPMTCPPDAFNSGEGLIVLEPGERHSVGWTISAI